MKNFTNNFKQFTSRLSARWLIMALMMLVGTSSAWAATITSDGSARLYFNMKAVSWWTAGTNGNGNFAYFFNNSTGKNAWSSHSVNYSGDTYYVTIPEGDWAGVILTRNNTSTAPSWNNKWNQTGDITLSSTSNYISKFSEGSASVTWGTAVKPASTASVTAASTSINVGENTTLSVALTSNTDLNTISSTSYTTTTGASIDGNTFTATAAGEYTVTATITYNPDGFTDITSTATATVTITVNAATYTVKKSESGTTGGTVKLGNTTLTTTAASINSGSYDLSINAPTGYKVSKVEVSGGSLTTAGTTGSATYTGKVNVSANTTINVTYAIMTYTVKKSESGTTGGTVKLGATTLTTTAASINSGSYDLSITAPNGYKVSKVEVSGGALTTAGTTGSSSYTGKVNVSANTTVTVTYARITYTVKKAETGTTGGTVKLGDTVLTTSNQSINSGSYALSITAPTGYKVTAVSVSAGTLTPGATGSSIYNGTLNVTAATTVTVTYAKLTYSISYNANGGSGAPTAETKNYGEPLILSSTVPTRTGYTFQNWNTKSDGTGDSYDSGASYTANAAATLYAQWEANTYTITYDANGGVNPPAAQTKTYGVSLTLTTSAPTRDGYNFINWNTKADGSGTSYTKGASFTTNAATTLYAQWEEICYQTATEGTGSYSNGTITLSAKFNTCGSAYIGFQWKEEGDDWCYEDNNSNPCFIPLDVQNKQNAIVTTTVAKPSGKSYVFRPYIVVGNDAKNWVYGTTFTVGTCTLPIINSTDAEFNKNNFADFAALYVTDCSGKEITGYQWYKDGVEYESKCEYTTKDGVVTGDAGRTNNIRPNAAGKYTCKVTYKDGNSATSAEFAVNATSGTTYADFKSNLPVIMVNTGSTNFPSCPVANETASKHADEMKEKLSVDVRILSDGKIVYDRKARMAYRGSSSLNFLKKSYAFCPGDANCGDAKKGADYVKTAKLNMLGIGEAADKDWVLYAAAADPSMLRNRMVFETYQAMRNVGVTEENKKEWGVKSRYVELIINGEYKGVYLMMDKITQNKKRVNVEWSVKDETKRGFILKFDKTDVADRSKDYPDGDEKTFLSKYSGAHNITTYDAKNDQAFEIEYPEKGDIEDDGGNWYDVINFIQGMINNFETALSAGEYQKVQQIIDYESWADWFILSEYTKNVDAFRASCVFVYDGTKLKATPLWDQELSFNNQSVHANRYKDDPNNKGCENVNGLLIKNDKVYSDSFAAPFWFTGKLAAGKGTEKLAAKTFTGALLNDPCFVQMVKNRWEAHKSGALSNASLTALITNYEKELTSAVRTREANFWNGKSRNTLSCSWNGNSTGYYDDTYITAKGHITAWINDDAASGSTGRRAGLSTAIDALKGTGLDIAIKPASIQTTPWVPVVIQVQNETGYEYTLTYTDGELDKQPNIIIEKSGDTYKYHIPRPWPAGDEQQEGERADINYVIKATLQVGEGNNQCGSSTELPSATATIVLQDEPNDSEKCK